MFTPELSLWRKDLVKRRQLAALREPSYVEIEYDTNVIIEIRNKDLPKLQRWSHKRIRYLVKSLSWLHKLRCLIKVRDNVIRQQVRDRVELEERHKQETERLAAKHRVQDAELGKAIDWHMSKTQAVVPEDVLVYQAGLIEDEQEPIDLNDIPF